MSSPLPSIPSHVHVRGKRRLLLPFFPLSEHKFLLPPPPLHGISHPRSPTCTCTCTWRRRLCILLPLPSSSLSFSSSPFFPFTLPPISVSLSLASLVMKIFPREERRVSLLYLPLHPSHSLHFLLRVPACAWGGDFSLLSSFSTRMCTCNEGGGGEDSVIFLSHMCLLFLVSCTHA